MTQAVDPAIAAAQATAAPESAGTATLDPLRKETDALLVSDPANPHHALYRQALERLELLGPERFKDRRERERVALAIAVQAAAAGLARIDRVAASDDGKGYFFVDAQAADPALRGYVEHARAAQATPQQQLAEMQRQQQLRQQEQQQRTQQGEREARLAHARNCGPQR